jgi:hypothetical protein
MRQKSKFIRVEMAENLDPKQMDYVFKNYSTFLGLSNPNLTKFIIYDKGPTPAF